MIPTDCMSPMGPAYLPSRQNHAYFCPGGDAERTDVSTHSRRDKSPHGSMRSGCSRRSGCESNNHCNGSTGHSGLCRTCGMSSERVYSQCLECHRLARAIDGLCSDCDCPQKSVQCCQSNNLAPHCCDVDPDDGKGDILESVMSSERKFLPDTNFQEQATVNHSTSSKKSVNSPHTFSHKMNDPVIKKVIEPEIEKNEKRNLDNVPISVPPLCSDRLKPARHKTSKSVLSILETGEVCFELLKKRNNGKKDKVIEVCRISSDGLRVSGKPAITSNYLNNSHCIIV